MRVYPVIPPKSLEAKQARATAVTREQAFREAHDKMLEVASVLAQRLHESHPMPSLSAVISEMWGKANAEKAVIHRIDSTGH